MKKTMKNIWKSLFVAALFVSCSESMTEETVAPEVNNGKAIKFEVATAGGRAAFFQGEGYGVSFEEGDEIGIRHYTGDSSEDNYAYGVTIEDSAEKNAWLNINQQRGNYQLTEGQWVMCETDDNGDAAANWQLVSFVDGVNNTICAYYPSTNNRYAHQISNVVLPATQVQAAANDHSHIGDYMIMMADPQKFAAGDQPETVNLQLQNILSIVEVTLKSDEAKSLMNLTMTSKTTPLAFTKGTLNTTKKVSTEGAACPIAIEEPVNEITLSMGGYAPVTAEGAKFYFVVLPGVHAANDITLTATMGDGSIAEIEMGAIEFKMNKVYRPVITLTEESYTKTAPQAEIYHSYHSQNGLSYTAVADFANEVLYVTNRTYVMRNLPAWLNGYKYVSSDSGFYPGVNKIKAVTEGIAYVMTKASLAADMAAAGWNAVTATTGDEQIYYGSATDATASSGKVAIYARYMEANEEFDLTTLYSFVTGFQCLHPIAKVLTSEQLAEDLYFNFKSKPKDDGGTLWNHATSMTNCKKNANVYKAPKTYAISGFTGLEFTFSYTLASGTDGDSAATYQGTCYRQNTSGDNNIKELLVQPGASNTETIGFPVREGYKLVRVNGLCVSGNQNATPVIAITSDADGTVYAGVVEGSTDTTISIVKKQATPWIFTIPNAEKDTRYYLAVSDAYLTIAEIYLTYEKVN